ncbi:MAG TPA: glycerophosphodiester phosphodiesterase family protein, partial [Bacteroidia bacterium]
SYFSDKICLDSGGNHIDTLRKSDYIIYKHTARNIRSYDCGSVFNPAFPRQEKMHTYKPLLEEVIDSVENHLIRHHRIAANYNLEIKSSPQGDNILHPAPDVFAKILVKLLKRKGVISRCIIQSFDCRALQAVHLLDNTVRTSLLIDEESSDFKRNIEQLGFVPDYYSPYFKLVNQPLVDYLHSKQIKLVPWTINNKEEMKKLIGLNVDGIITDYPDSLISLLKGMR